MVSSGGGGENEVPFTCRRRGPGVSGGVVFGMRGVDWIALVGEPGTEDFYRSLGFRAPAGFTFWRV